MDALIRHYDQLVMEGNDPFRDPPVLRAYMDRWDGEPFLELLALAPDVSALEIGVGTGRLAGRVLPRCARLVGIDCSPRTIRRAQENLRGAEHLELLCGDFMTWPFEERFDRIYSSLTLWHIRDKRAAIDKAASLLAPGGRLVLSLSKECERSLCCFEGVEVPLYPDDPADTRRFMQEAGLTPIEERDTEFAHLLCAVAPDEPI